MPDSADGALRAAAIALLQARRAGRVNDDDEEAVLNAARHSGISAAAAAIAARDCALAGLTSDEPFARLAAIVSRRCAEAPAAARAQCGLAALRLPRRTWRRLGGKLTFSDDAALAELWDYSKSRKKVTQTPSARGGFDWPPAFEDPSRPLVVDAGCGFGALAAALAKARPHVNVLAVDRAAHCLLYGAGLAHRLGMTGRLRFACASADEALHWVRECYAGPLRAVLFMFPTPPALDERSKNAQLPQTPSKCLVNAATLRLAARAGRAGETCVLVASNVEDVAVGGGVLLPLDAAMAWRRETHASIDAGPHARPLRESAGISRPPGAGVRPRVAAKPGRRRRGAANEAMDRVRRRAGRRRGLPRGVAATSENGNGGAVREGLSAGVPRGGGCV